MFETIYNCIRHLKYTPVLFFALFSVMFTFGLLLSHDKYLSDLASVHLRSKRNADSGRKCDLTVELAKRSIEFNNYETSSHFMKKDVNKVVVYDPVKHALGFVHIQKTGGSLLASYISDQSKKSVIESPGNTAANSNNALFHMMCGLHSDRNSVIGCTEHLLLPSKQTSSPSMLLLTMLRDPTDRYISEWLHISRGSTWYQTVTQCTKEAIPHMEPAPSCIPETFDAKRAMFPLPDKPRDRASLQRWAAGSSRYTGWEEVTLDSFMSCPDNPATNRMVNMLADHTVLGDECNGSKLHKTDRDNRLLSSAKDSLLKMAMFGLTEHQAKTEQLLRAVLGVQFKVNLQQRTENHVSCLKITESQRTAIQKLNHLDHQLYVYAKDLFYERLKAHHLL